MHGSGVLMINDSLLKMFCRCWVMFSYALLWHLATQSFVANSPKCFKSYCVIFLQIVGNNKYGSKVALMLNFPELHFGFIFVTLVGICCMIWGRTCFFSFLRKRSLLSTLPWCWSFVGKLFWSGSSEKAYMLFWWFVLHITPCEIPA